MVEHLAARGDAARALMLLRRPGVPRELAYKFAPALMAAAPDATVEAWLSAQPPLDPRQGSHCHHATSVTVLRK